MTGYLGINAATPAEWDKLRREHPALENTESIDYKPYIDMAMAEAHALNKQDTPINPSHYTNGSIECIDAMQSAMTSNEFKGYLRGCIIKYLWRLGLKDPGNIPVTQDLEKAKWYLDKLIVETIEANKS